MLDIESRKESCKKLLDELENSSSENEIHLFKQKVTFLAYQIERENPDIAHTLMPHQFPPTSFHDNKYDLKFGILQTIQKLDDLKSEQHYS